MRNHSISLGLALVVLALVTAPVTAQKGAGAPGGYLSHSGFVLGGHFVVDFGFPGNGNGVAAFGLSDSYGPENHPLLGLTYLAYSSPNYVPVVLSPDLNGNVRLEGDLPVQVGFLGLGPYYIHGFSAGPNIPSPGWSLSKTAMITFDTQDGYRAVGSMTQGRTMHTAVSLSRSPRDEETRVFLAGGGFGTVLAPIPTNTTEFYVPMKRAFEAGPAMFEARQRHEAVLLLDGRVLLSGGINSTLNATPTCEILDPTTDTLSIAATMNVPRVGHRMTLLNDGRVFVSGGLTNWNLAAGSLAASCNTSLASAEIYDPVANTWTPVPAGMAHGRAGHSQTKLLDGRLLIAFGISGGQTFGGGDMPLFGNTTQIYDPVAGTFSSSYTTLVTNGPTSITTGPLGNPFARAFHGASLLPTGEVLITGGMGNVSSQVIYYSSTFQTVVQSSVGKFDPATLNWTQLATAGVAVAFQAQETSLMNGQPIIMGGLTDVTAFTGTSRAWRHTAFLPFDTQNIGTHSGLGITTSVASGNLTMTRLYDGFTYLVCGGSDANGLVRSSAFIVHEY